MAAVVNAITSTFSGLLNPRRNGVAFPDDVHETVIKACIDSCVASIGLQPCGIRQELAQQKMLLKIALVSKLFCYLACKEWNAYWPIPHSRPPANYWILARPNFYFQSCPVDLSQWSRLRLACLDFSDAFRYQNNAWNIPLLVSGLPQSLERIEFRRPHATEIDVIELLKRLCPGVVELRIVHCTMFNRPDCMWWHGHQAQEDHLYIKGSDTHEVVNHAESLAQRLQGLPNLQQLHLEVYFVPFDAITAHRDDHTSYHRVKDKKWYVDGIQYHNAVHFEATWDDEHHNWPLPNLQLPRLAPIGIWQTKCPLCVQEYSGQAERAERLTGSVLAARHWMLRKVSFPSYFSDDSITPNIWEVERWLGHPSGPRLQVDPGALPQDGYADGTKLYVYTERVGGRSSREGTSFRWSGAGWVPEV